MAITVGARPVGLSGCWSKWSENDIDNTVRSEFENGKLKVRRRYTGRARIVKAAVTLPKAQYQSFINWWEVNQKQGSVATKVITPYGTEEVFQWTKPPSISWVGGGAAFTASVEMYQGSWF